MSTEEYMEITKGSHYSVKLGKDDEISGVFKGYSIIGSESALVIDSKGTIRYIPIGKILFMTLIESKVPETEKKKEDPGIYYG